MITKDAISKEKEFFTMRLRKKKNTPTRLEFYKDFFLDFSNATKEEPTEYINFKEIFGNDNPVHIEIGCGKGQFITGMAEKNPDINYVAIDVVPDVLVIALEKATAAEVENVRFIIADANWKKLEKE